MVSSRILSYRYPWRMAINSSFLGHPMNSRRVGAAFERKIAAALRQWLGEDYEVVRNPPDMQAGKDGRAGEFSISGPLPVPLCLECKTSRQFRAAQLWAGTGLFVAWWAQASAQADSVSKHPVLVCKRPQGPILCAMRRHTWSALFQVRRCPHMAVVVADGDELVVVLWSALMALDSIRLGEL